MAVIVSGCNFLIQIRLGIWLMSKKPVAYGAFQILLSLVNVGLSLAFVILLKQGYAGRLWGQALAIFVFALFALFSLIGAGWVNFRPSLVYIREALHFGVPLIPHIIGGLLLGLADRFIINQKLGLEAAGIYMVAVQLGLGMGLITGAFNKSFVPWLYEQLSINDPSSMRLLVKGTWLYFVVAMLSAVGIALLAYPVVILIAGSQYAEASPALVWIALGQAFGGMYLMVTNYIFYKRKTMALSLVSLFSGGISITLTWVLIPRLGIAGAGLSFAIGMCLRFFMTWALAQRVCPMPWFSFGRTHTELIGRG
jgi:O-antigen/teichoic acid export membrane protein